MIFMTNDFTYLGNSFIGGWYIPEDICDQIIDFYNKNKSLHGPGVVGGNKEPTIDVEFKKCTQLEVIPFPQELSFYNVHLQHTLNHYIKKYEYTSLQARRRVLSMAH